MTNHVRAVAALCFCCLALLASPAPCAAQSKPEPSPSESAAPKELIFPVTVTDSYGRPIAGLGKEHFAVSEGKTPRDLTSFRGPSREPVSVALIFDVSGSMEKLLDHTKAAAAGFVKRGHAEDEYFVAEFGGKDGLRVLHDWTRDGAAVGAAMDKIAVSNSKGGKPKARGNTYWQDACAAALTSVARASHARRVMIWLGDAGPDMGSRTGEGELKRRMRESDVMFYALSVVNSTSTSSFDVTSQTLLHELSILTGGRAYFASTPLELGEVVERVATELAQQYFIGFVPANTAGAGKWNKVKVKVTPPAGLKKSIYVRSREGYYSRADSRKS